ncbi:hydroxyacylglutathione hydrolase-like protein isoform X1 [Ahaetulla prasina]|uniref:hydroxyacylglutathione hydrolase-like protein isoform X1 n=1 Tax=Ahaetulla prasina TaxID=499056 RepID=UPI002647F472|nr:hydroxyacylglutathione hydrolase-like protein isoform X1 [Ahaetulla prasina]XP_058013366.1 hydroxyacylglutathione hydrolase-like protein isoform X1 [Ahaetulla prasina]XP_058013367.1 hydroxyacylglutathione hydrolase-like protein isoform X1 [Ahaetulla prasina]XP_058013368.1 hydroxyacylglutathione hydrolase-like protein isoform X1 [Ahaetulla prasina]
MKVKVISILEDNYMYLIIEETTREAIAVDAAVSKRLLEIIRREDIILKAILTTHHHWDHARDNEELAKIYPGLEIYGGDERVGALTHRVTHEEELKFGSINIRCLLTPGHTSGHVCYFVWENDSLNAPAAFTGDTLFVGGCGRLLECPAEQLYKSLMEVLGGLPKETLREDEDLPTVPSTLAEEFLYNPFLRILEEPVQKFTGKSAPVESFAALCKAKESFRKPKERLNPQAMLAFEWGLFDPLLQK